MRRSDAWRRSVELLDEVGIPDPARRVHDYPHQFSGGMRQRVMLAIALALRPRLLLADEPTTALDVTVQAQLLDLLNRLQRDHGMAVVLVSHDLGVIGRVADRVLTMYAGRIVEESTTAEVFATPHHPYTRGLLSCIPGSSTRGTSLVPIPGQPPSLLRLPPGCAFAPRCVHAEDRCRESLPPRPDDLGHASIGVHPPGRGRRATDDASPWRSSAPNRTRAMRPTGPVSTRRPSRRCSG